jgi:hypothetical protein
MFMVGLANLTFGGNYASDVLEDIDQDDQFDDHDFVNARGAFYLKGKVKGKYLVTAQLDTREDAFKHWDDQLKRKNRTQLFRELDPERYYPVYGDDSSTYSDVDSQGAYYVRVDWDKSRALWGNFNTDITANEFAHYSRSLYGAQLVYRTPELTEYGQYKNTLVAFASEAQSAAAHNEFRATGGSLYYLQNTEVVVGSEKLWIEIREKDSIQVVERYRLRAGVDYEVDYFQGRIILTQPLSQIAQRIAPSIIQSQPLQGDDVFLLADYEYVPDHFSLDNVVAGARVKTWFNDSVGLGATLINEARDTEDYSLRGVDASYQLAKGTYIKAEVSKSKAGQSTSGLISDDGGLTFQSTPAQATLKREGKATGVELLIDLAELSGGLESGELKVWKKDRDQGFSSSRDDRGVKVQDQGAQGRWAVNDNIQLSMRTKRLQLGNDSELTSLSAQVDAEISDSLSTGIEVQRSEESTEGELDKNATLGGARINYQLNTQTRLFAKAQAVMSSTKAYGENNQLSVGTNSKVNERLSLGAEVVSGHRGDGMVLSGDYLLSEHAGVNVSAGFGDGADSQVAANYKLENGLNLYGTFTRARVDNNQEKSTLTLGQRKKWGKSLELFAENQFSDVDQQTGLAHVFGVDYDINDFTGASLSFQHSAIDRKGDENISRNAATLGLQYKRDQIKGSTKLEYRRDRSSIDITQWLTSNALEWQQTRDYRWLGRFNYSRSKNDNSGQEDAKFVESSIGFAYRPALNDRFNLLSRLSYIYDLPSLGQDTTAVDERAWVLAVEGVYAINQQWELGGKYAHKKGELRQQRGTGPWFDSTINFYALRARYHMLHTWDGLMEYRWLESVQDKTIKSGLLLGLYKHVGDHVKLGVGFNFTDFNDDLTNLDYDNKGWFLDITAKY